MSNTFKFCPQCATQLEMVMQLEDGGEKARLRCPACGYTHWNNPTPVLAAVIEYNGQILLARNAAWQGRIGDDLYGGVFLLGPWLLHPAALLFALSGSLMISKTLHIPKL